MAAYLDRRGSSKWDLIFSHIVVLAVFYFMYASCYFLWSGIVFPSFIAKGINDLYFFYINFLEFMGFFFIRTRSSIKYLPKLLMMLNLWFMVYINEYFYSAQYEAFSFIWTCSMLFFLFFLKFYE